MHQRTGTRLTHNVCYHRLNGTNNISPKPKSEAQITVVICNSHVYDSTAVRRCSAVTLTSATLTEPRLNTQKLCSGCNVHGPPPRGTPSNPLLPDWPAAAERWRTRRSRGRRSDGGARGWGDPRCHRARSDGGGGSNEVPGA